MQTHRLTTLVTLALTTLLLQACSQEAPVQSEPVAEAPPPETTTSVYDWHARGVPAGETTIERAGDGRVTTEAFVHWNNREYRLQSELQLDADGMVISQQITGVSPFGATVNESFSYADGEANWRTMGESGSAQSTRAAFYVPTEWGAVGSMEALVRAASKQIGGELALFPAGAARVEKLADATVPTPDGEATLSLYAISGIDFSPTFAWFNEDMTLAARDLGRMGMLPQGWDPAVLETLASIQGEQNALRAERLSAELAHRVDGAERIDGSGKYLMPGLWDMHGHFSLEDGLLNIAGGVTSVRDLGSTHERLVELKQKFHSGEVIGPTTYAGAMIDGLSQYTSRNPAKDLDTALAMIDHFHEQGYIQIKLYSSITPEWVPAIRERTAQHGMRLSGHIPAFMSAEQAVRAGYDEIQHINMVFLNFLAGDREDTRRQIRFNLYGSEGGKLDLDSPEVEKFIALLKESGTTVDPTAAIFDSMMTHVAGQPDPTFAKVADHLPLAVRRSLYNPSFEIGEERIEDWANTAVRQGEMIKKLYDNGIQLVAGSDDMPGFTMHRELELYAQAGIPNADVLKIATLDSARIVGVAEQTGSIEVGKAADLVLLDGNPLEDISAIRTGVLVMKGGAIYKPEELYRAVGVEPF